MLQTATFYNAKLKQASEQCFYYDVLTILKCFFFEIMYPMTYTVNMFLSFTR